MNHWKAERQNRTTSFTSPDDPLRAVALGSGMVIATLLVFLLNANIVEDDPLAFGPDYLKHPVFFEGRRLNEWLPERFPLVYLPEDADPAESEGLWIGNSQINAIYGDPIETTVACKVASEKLGVPVFGLSMGSANYQELLVVLHWALSRRDFDWVVLPLTYMSLRRDGLRHELTYLLSEDVSANLRRGPVGVRLADELQAMKREDSDVQGTGRRGTSLQSISESRLTDALERHLSIWTRRADLVSVLARSALKVRNRLFGIDLTTTRQFSRVRRDKNMQALEEFIATTSERQVKLVLYVVPARWDHAPPFDIDEYVAWKEELAGRAATLNISLVDLDHAVPETLWSIPGAERLDLIHFKEPGHHILGERVAELMTSERPRDITD